MTAVVLPGQEPLFDPYARIDRGQRWRERNGVWCPAREVFDPRGFEVRPIPDDTTASAFIITHHYSGAYVAARHRFGLFRGDELVGVAVYSNPAALAVLTCVLPELDPTSESVELGRFVLLDGIGFNVETWLIARCHALLLEAGVAGVVSFSDPVPRRMPNGTLITPGHIGQIYQASNAVYTGRAWARTLWVLPDGSIFNGQAQQKIRDQKRGHEYAERQLIRWGARPMRAGEDPRSWLREARGACRVAYFRHPGVHRYVFTLGRNARARRQIKVALPALPYPTTRETRELVAA